MEPTTILLVEDDAAIRSMLAGCLALHGYAVIEVSNRNDALARLRNDPQIRLVILDLGLAPCPHETVEGIATLRAIQQEVMPVKVIVLTGQDHEAAALEAVREGAFDFLSKPAGAETILSAVRRAELFHYNEQQLGREGLARIAITAHIGDGLKSVRSDAEERLVRQVLKETGFNIYQTAKRLGVKRENVYYFLKKYEIQREG